MDQDQMDKEHDSKSESPSHDWGTGKGEEKSTTEGKEPGREDAGTTHADRPAGTSTQRDSTSINPDDREPRDPDSPNFPAP
ncbi:MAG: hypothetical protein H0W99_09515 [Acidobacteria bacterium]|nr:hypothetical protein [Acidobacteriota bacterium]